MIVPKWLRTGVVLSIGLSLLSGCSKRVIVEDGAFEAQEKIVLNFSGGRSLQGKIDTDRGVRYEDNGAVYRAKVKSLSEDSIVLEELILVQDGESLEEVNYRLADARIDVVEVDMLNVILSRSEIETVEKVVFDGTRTLQNVTFWSISGTVFGLLLSDHP